MLWEMCTKILHFKLMQKCRELDLRSGIGNEKLKFVYPAFMEAPRSDPACLLSKHWKVENSSL